MQEHVNMLWKYISQKEILPAISRRKFCRQQLMRSVLIAVKSYHLIFHSRFQVFSRWIDLFFALTADSVLMQARPAQNLKEMLKFWKLTAATSRSARGCNFVQRKENCHPLLDDESIFGLMRIIFSTIHFFHSNHK